MAIEAKSMAISVSRNSRDIRCQSRRLMRNTMVSAPKAAPYMLAEATYPACWLLNFRASIRPLTMAGMMFT